MDPIPCASHRRVEQLQCAQTAQFEKELQNIPLRFCISLCVPPLPRESEYTSFQVGLTIRAEGSFVKHFLRPATIVYVILRGF